MCHAIYIDESLNASCFLRTPEMHNFSEPFFKCDHFM